MKLEPVGLVGSVPLKVVRSRTYDVNHRDVTFKIAFEERFTAHLTVVRESSRFRRMELAYKSSCCSSAVLAGTSYKKATPRHLVDKSFCRSCQSIIPLAHEQVQASFVPDEYAYPLDAARLLSQSSDALCKLAESWLSVALNPLEAALEASDYGGLLLNIMDDEDGLLMLMANAPKNSKYRP